MTAAAAILAVCRHYDVHPDAIRARCRKPAYTRPRAVLCYLLRWHCGLRWREVAAIVRRDHSTCMHHARTVQGFLDVYPDFNLPGADA